ncbi:hypothetical protein D9619_011180 [Psilocybe cf. subviscida]|uniref:Uncharacterized protein n=1 Tax=Psilocybe cf. subviscida TaxID=2480587 RepID=A0A8H5BJR2_9AGAR|nr:hypothetical protein D9619_011180 [Psilocybe cf. subviscida]
MLNIPLGLRAAALCPSLLPFERNQTLSLPSTLAAAIAAQPFDQNRTFPPLSALDAQPIITHKRRTLGDVPTLFLPNSADRLFPLAAVEIFVI